MAEKIKINEYGDCIFSEDYLIEHIYSNPLTDISQLHLKSPSQYLKALEDSGIDLPVPKQLLKSTLPLEEFDLANTEQWSMPVNYEIINVEQWLLDKCTNDTEKQRVIDEMKLFNKKGFIKVLQFLMYFIDTLRNNNVVWGVGRGSSVSSFCLFLIGVHKINPLLYDLDYKEFLR